MRTVLLALALLLAGASALRAQQMLEPIVEAAPSPCIDAEQARDAGLFDEYPGFLRACLYRVPGGGHVLTIHYRSEGRTLRVDREIKAEELRALRIALRESLEPEPEIEHLPHPASGRPRLLVDSMILSLGYYGWALPAAAGVEDGKGFVAGYMLTSAAGFYLPFTLTRNASVSGAQATLAFYGGSRGIAWGQLLTGLAVGPDVTERTLFGVGAVTSVMSGIAGYQTAGRRGMDGGTAEMIGLGGDFGAAFGLGTAHLTGVTFTQEQNRAWCGATLLGAGAGLYLGSRAARVGHYTRGDARVLSTVGLVAASAGLAAADLTNPSENRFYSASLMAGALAGLYAGERMLRDEDFTAGQGTLVRLGTLGGGLMGAGLAYLTAPAHDEGDSRRYTLGTAVGGAVGFAVLYGIYADDARARAARGSASRADLDSMRWSLGLEPRVAADRDVRTFLVVRARF